MTESQRATLFIALCTLAFMETGAHISQSFVNYPGWYVLETASFKAYHWPMSIRAAIFLMAPRVVELMLALAVLRFRPQAVERWVVVSGALLVAGGILSTILIQRPIHAQMDIHGNTPELVSRLIAADWIRNVPEWTRAALYAWALTRLASAKPHILSAIDISTASRVLPRAPR